MGDRKKKTAKRRLDRRQRRTIECQLTWERNLDVSLEKLNSVLEKQIETFCGVFKINPYFHEKTGKTWKGWVLPLYPARHCKTQKKKPVLKRVEGRFRKKRQAWKPT